MLAGIKNWFSGALSDANGKADVAELVALMICLTFVGLEIYVVLWNHTFDATTYALASLSLLGGKGLGDWLRNK